MTDERRLMAAGMPLEGSISNCCTMRLEETLPEFVSEQKNHHECKCGGTGNCPDCPNRSR